MYLYDFERIRIPAQLLRQRRIGPEPRVPFDTVKRYPILLAHEDDARIALDGVLLALCWLARHKYRTLR